MPPTTPTVPLSTGQQALWLAHRLAPDSAAYTIVLPVRLCGPLDSDALAAAVRTVAARHPLLRSVFAEADGYRRGEPCRIVLDEPAPDVLTVRELPDAGDAEVRALVRTCAEETFRIGERPPFRVTLLRRDAQDAVLVIAAHHIISDYASHHLILRELLAAHREFADGNGPEPVVGPDVYDEQVTAERRLLASARGARSAAYWRKVRTGAPPAELPADRPRPQTQGFRGATHELPLPTATVGRLTETAKALDVTLFAVLLGVFQATLYRHSGQPDALVGCPMSARAALGAGRRMDGVVGYFVNTVPMRGSFRPGDRIRDVVRAVQRQLVQGLMHAGHPGSQPAGAPDGRTAPFRTAVTLIATDRTEPRLGPVGAGGEGTPRPYAGLSVARIGVPQQEGQFDLMLRIEQSGDALDAVFSYDTDLFEAGTIARFAQRYARLIDRAADDPDAAVDAISLVDRTDLAELLAMGSGTV
ncbi:condensation domain-containing protein [Streptomyces sp. NPDC087228]|uniref:condensation domain-containing protein n=1 Tax=Streptomyces sp. NPDC087228 TaxID=3365772 RepID=UPI003822775B